LAVHNVGLLEWAWVAFNLGHRVEEAVPSAAVVVVVEGCVVDNDSSYLKYDFVIFLTTCCQCFPLIIHQK
jgi:hypothetical protein